MSNYLRIFLYSSFILHLSSFSSFALGPQEVALLVNQRSPQSLEVANHYAALRGIPAGNIILLDLPAYVLEPAAEIKPEDFTRFIWEPTTRIIRERGLTDHILAWVYSIDFPIKISSTPPVSIMGMTFVRNKLPPPDQINQGSFASPLFSGPSKPQGPLRASLTFVQQVQRLNRAMPLPSMMLGFAGSRGQKTEDILQSLKLSRQADQTPPVGAIYFLENDDVRTRMRSWQFTEAQAELQELGIPTFVTSNAPGATAQLAGLMTGSPWVTPNSLGSFLPGSVADHLTSFGACFDKSDQTKITEWLRAGASATAGTIVEPLSYWTKFPSARFYAHYARGCSIIESYYQSIRSPMQILLLGDPLCSPWSIPPGLSLVSLSEKTSAPLKGLAEFAVSAWAGLGSPQLDLVILLDGHSLNLSPQNMFIKLNTEPLTDGYHEMAVMGYSRDPLRQQATATLGFMVQNRGHAVRFEGLPPDGQIPLEKPMRFQIAATGKPDAVALICREKVVYRTTWASNAWHELDPAGLGKGPVSLQAAAIYGKESVRSEPVRLTVQAAPLPEPSWASLQKSPEGTSPLPCPIQITPSLVEGSGDLHQPAAGQPSPASSSTQFVFSFRFPSVHHLTSNQIAGFVFESTNDQEKTFAGFHGENCSWMVATISNETLNVKGSRGAPVYPTEWTTLRLRQESTNAWAFYLHDKPLFTLKDVPGIPVMAFGRSSGEFRVPKKGSAED